MIAYDGSKAAQAALRSAAELFADRRALVLTAWEPGLGELMLVPDPTGFGTAVLPFDPAVAREIDQEVQDNARAIAQAGVELAKRLGMDAQELLVQNQSADPTQAILAAATEHDAAAIVLGSRGHRGLRSKLLGSTSKGVLERAEGTPVLITHEAVERS